MTFHDPTDETSSDYQFEGTILCWNGLVFFRSREALHVLDEVTGLWREGALHPFLALKGKAAPVCHLCRENYLFLCCPNTLLCLNLQTRKLLRELDLSCTGYNYQPGCLEWIGELLTCFGRNALLLVDPETGKIADSIKIPRIDKLFCPQLQPDGQLVMGYTNWTVAGVLRYDPSAKKVLWRHRRKFEGPQHHCRLWFREDRVFWVKNDRELICLDLQTGRECYSVPTTP